ncbi:unnamed protein product (macronuclear) [Paramecium tetraurelia]|uniref:EGF-like domain-containing protein n=1 Tax=Paramecium tetraurelia TaxID=5888 RepID=A0EGW6_PARTE|nr:uncharacterized protein GSPATT00026881001 [Paramecium tetraurelia]CAK94557.1 unnamed protein product [Paramecium tetraurelia]|eukprot:XP_001461930.1 hypothetical protein (macronuclear) [Paramecium tetraurelia strain d4-2]
MHFTTLQRYKQYQVCSACPSGKYQSPSGGGCSNNCMASCTTCSDGTTCDTCSGANQYLSLPSQTCTSCPTGCLTCDSFSCLSCTTGYYLSTICIQCSTPCSTCSSSTNCSACNSGYYLSGSSCLSCTSPSTYCGSPCSCSSGYYLVGSCCYPCQSPCAQCSGSATSCTACVDPTNQSTPSCNCNLPTKYLDYLNNYQCSNCVSPCLNCSSSSSCSSCINTYYLQVTSCYPCTSPCVNCSTSSTNCTSCIDSAHQSTPSCQCSSGYLMNTSTHMCNACTFPCLTCQNSVSECHSCASTYQYDSTAHTCTCLTNQYEDSGSPKTCQNCQSPCLTCSSNVNCNSCISGINRHLSGSSCICDDGYYDNAGVCTLCSLPCTKCTSPTVCTECYQISYQVLSDCHCMNTYYMDATFTCQSCISPCLNCSSNSVCTSCIDNYYLDTTNCVQCTLPCFNCVDIDTKCTSCAHPQQTVQSNQCVCDDGYYMDVSYYCQLCTYPCSKCTNTSTQCTDCASTFISSGSNSCICADGKYEETTNSPSDCQTCTSPCVKCEITSIHCLTCIDTNQSVDPSSYQCICNIGWVANGNYCDQCLSPCTSCSGTTTYCTACKDAHHQIVSGQCICESGWVNDANYDCQPCVSPCSSCSINTTHCDSCLDIHHIINASYQCICQDTYYSDTISHCEPCVLPCANCDINGCLTCIDTNQYIDSNLDCVCNNGYYMDTVNCSLCQLPCVYCTTLLDCLTCIDANQSIVGDRCVCNDGYYANGNYCNQCQLPCTKCVTTQNTCTQCVDPNHLLINNNCVCKPGYGQSGLNGNYCSICQYPCLECSININTCTKCVDQNLFKLENNQCQCQEGYYKDNNNQCQICAPQCKTCEEFLDYCLICKDDSFILINNQCSCNSGYFLNNQNNCQACIEYCLQCNDQISCEVCKDGYFYESMVCNKCSNNCKTCLNQNDFCQSCNNNYDLNNNQCKCGVGFYEQNDTCIKCKYPCIDCSNETTCLQCAQIQKLSLSNQQKCICQDGYYWSISECQLCHTNCLTCQETSIKCLSCDLSLNKILQNDQCVCTSNYYLSDENTCTTCDSEQGKVTESCKYKNCNDLVWTYGEDCDDGNQIIGDGCSNCKIDNNYICANTIMQISLCYQCSQFCISCQQNSITKLSECVKCKSGYYLNENLCQICDKQCKECESNPQNCTSCRFLQLSSQRCKLCESKQGYYSDYSINTCYTKCGDSIVADSEQCDDGNQINGDGCSNKCLIEKKFICQNDVCITPNYPNPKLSIFGTPKRYEKERSFKLEYNVPLKIIKSTFDLSSDLKFYIENRSGDVYLLDYPYSFIQNMTEVENSYYYYEAIITLQLNQSSQYQIFNIYFLNLSLIQSKEGYEQIIDHVKASIEEYLLVDETTQSLTETLGSFSINLFYILLILLAVSILLGGLDIFYNLLDTIQLLSYLKYINLKFPYNLQTYFEIFGFAQLSFIQNYLKIEDFFSDFISIQDLKPLPKKIRDDNYSSIYLVNICQILSVYVMLFGIYSVAFIIPLTIRQVRFKYYEDYPEKDAFILKLKVYFLSIKIFIGEMCSKVVNELFYSGILRTFMATAYDYSFLMVLQIYSIDISSNSLLLSFSSLISLLAFLFYIAICLLIIYLLGKHKLSLTCKPNIEKFGSIIEGIKLKNNYQKCFNVILLIKKLMFMIILVFCYEDPLSQTVNLFLLSLITALYLFHHKPIEDQNEYNKQLSTEISLCLTYVFLIILIINEQIKRLNIKEQSYIGWICIVFITSIIVIQLIIDLIQQWRMLLKKFATLRRFINKISNMFKKKAEEAHPNQNVFEEIQNHEFYQSIILYK